jgi:hypothetical protein
VTATTSPLTRAEERELATAYLTRTGNADLLDVLGLVESDGPLVDEEGRRLCPDCRRVLPADRHYCRRSSCPSVQRLAEEEPDAPLAPPSEPTPPPVAAAPAPAAPPAAEAGPDGEPPAPVDATPDVDVVRQVDEIVAEGRAAAGRLYAHRSSRRTPARPAAPALGVERAAPGGPDAVEEVAVASTSATAAASCADVRWDPPPAGVQATPEPLDLAPFLGASLHSYAAWYCARCYQRRHDPGACPGCRRPLVPVHVVIVPRSLV